MRAVERSEILDYVTYEEQRSELRLQFMAAKEQRRVQVGDHLTFLFENRDTVRYQVQEMMRTERLVKEADILHELETYNELLGTGGQLGASLLIGLDPEERDDKLRAWVDMPKHLYLKLEDGSRAAAIYDERQVGDDRLSSVQYLKFDCQGKTPVAIGSDHPEYQAETFLTDEQKAALAADLAEAD